MKYHSDPGCRLAFGRGNPEQGGDPGMPLHQWYAGQAPTGLIVGYAICCGSPTRSPAGVVTEASLYAGVTADRYREHEDAGRVT